MPLSVPQQQPGMEVPAPKSYVKAFVDPRQEVVSQADYRHLFGTAGPIYSQQQFRDNSSMVMLLLLSHINLFLQYARQ